jgi:solute:Na+ symporter, SSS family
VGVLAAAVVVRVLINFALVVVPLVVANKLFGPLGDASYGKVVTTVLPSWLYFILYKPNAAWGGQTYHQRIGLDRLHYIDVMLIVLVTSVIFSLAVNRLAFKNRAVFIWSAKGREIAHISGELCSPRD